MNDVEALKNLAGNLFNFESEQEELEHIASMKSLSFLKGLKSHMEQEGISKKDLAESLGTSKSYITQLFTGDRLLNLKLICRIEKALGVNFEVQLHTRQNLGKVVSPLEQKEGGRPFSIRLSPPAERKRAANYFWGAPKGKVSSES